MLSLLEMEYLVSASRVMGNSPKLVFLLEYIHVHRVRNKLGDCSARLVPLPEEQE